MNLLDIQTSFSLFMVFIPSVNVWIVNRYFLEKYSMKSYYFCSLAWFFDSPKVPKDANNIRLSQSSNSRFSITTVFISSLQVSIKNCNFYKGVWLKNYYLGSLARLFDSPKFPKEAINDFSSCFRINFLTSYSFDFFPQCLNQKVYISREVSVSKKIFLRFDADF